MQKVKILAKSTSWTNIIVCTFLVKIPTCLLAELRTHRLMRWSDTDFSLNANSDRAIPIKTKLKMMEKERYEPVVSTANRGMMAIENVDIDTERVLKGFYGQAGDRAIKSVKAMSDFNASKQYANRPLMPYTYSECLLSGDQFAWQDFFRQRTTAQTDPSFRKIAKEMQELYLDTEPVFLNIDEWHFPFDDILSNYEIDKRLIISMSCSARISYDIDKNEDYQKHFSRTQRCINDEHVSIAEHQFKVPSFEEVQFFNKTFSVVENEMKISTGKYFSNVNGWIMLRKMIEWGEFKI
jgi:thymidylate synthase ThyX